MLLSIEDCLEIRDQLLEFFRELEFDEPTHTYRLRGKELKSVSALIKYFVEPFDDEQGALDYGASRGIDPVQVLSAWRGNSKRSTDQGHGVHQFGEDYARAMFYGVGDTPIANSLQELGIVQWWQDVAFAHDLRYFPVGLELQMFSELYWYSGTADIILIDRMDKCLIISDWKTNRDIFKRSYSNMKVEGFRDWRSRDFDKYTLQFSFYQLMLMEAGYKVKARRLVWLQKDERTKKLYQNFPTEDVTARLRNWLLTKEHLV